VTAILYCHGFASSPASAKITLLRGMIEPEIEIHAPDLNVPSFERLDFDAAVDHAMSIASRIEPRAVVGSSMGALIALSVIARGVRAPLVLIAPALGVADRWISRIPEGDPISIFNYARNANAPIHRAFFEEMARLTVDHQPPPVPVTAIMGTDDESVPFERVESVWRSWEDHGLAAGSRFIAINGGDHGLTAHVDVIANAIVAATSS
jgi:alpha-beta hydrolase superfamily lysophospholipase